MEVRRKPAVKKFAREEDMTLANLDSGQMISCDPSVTLEVRL